jgi:hypothetical protein
MGLSITPKDNFRPQNSQETLQCNSEKRSSNAPKGMITKCNFYFYFLYHEKNNEKFLPKLISKGSLSQE